MVSPQGGRVRRHRAGRRGLITGRRPLAPSRRRRRGGRVAGRLAAAVLRRRGAAVHHVVAPAAGSARGRDSPAAGRPPALGQRHREPRRPDILRGIFHGVLRRRDRAPSAGPLHGHR